MSKYNGLSTLEVLEEAKNYNRWIAENFMHHLESPVLEIGAGTGNISAFFLSAREIILSDVDENLVNHLRAKFAVQSKAEIIQLDITQKIPKKFLQHFSTIVGINVLEHIEEDTKTLSLLHNALKKDGKLLLLVPAQQMAFTKLDKTLGHFRRYEKAELKDKLQKAGFRIHTMHYFNLVGLLSWMVRDKIGRSPNLKPYHITIFDSIVPILKRIEVVIRPPVGISLIVVAKKI